MHGSVLCMDEEVLAGTPSRLGFPAHHKDVPPRLYYFRATSEASVRYDRTMELGHRHPSTYVPRQPSLLTL